MAILLILLRDVLFFLVSIFYRNSVKHYTINPLEEIRKHQADRDRLKFLFPHLKNIKAQESHFLKQASTLSAAAVIGIFSWPSTANSVWMAKLLWYSSLFFSIFGLISSSTQRMLDVLPDNEDCELLDNDVTLLLDLFLKTPSRLPAAAAAAAAAEDKTTIDLELADCPPERESSFAVMWSLQTSMMLMSWSWVLFLLGYALFLLTPVIHREPWTVQHTICVVAMVFGAFALGNYFISSALTDARTSNFEQRLAEMDGPSWCQKRRASLV